MSTSSRDPVLLVGGSGVVGSQTARTLRRLHPGLPITIGGRDRGKADAVAAEIGNAGAAHSLRFAQAARVPHVSISSGQRRTSTASA